MQLPYLDGLVVKEQSGFFWVEVTDGVVYMCRLRGRLMEEAQSSDIASIGDRVQISIVENDESGDKGVIESVEERHSVLSRSARTVGNRGGGDAEREHVIVANADAIFLVFAASHPAPKTQLLDRLLVASEISDVEEIVIVVNKVDLEDFATIENIFQPYVRMGYQVVYTSAKEGTGIEELRGLLRGKISALTGPSGVGKTSLLNQLQPDLGRQVKQVSNYHQEGVHTTRDSILIKLDSDIYGTNTYLADTPGMRNINIYDVEPEELDGYFRDIALYVEHCQFRNCRHTKIDRGCAVREATQKGEIAVARYQSFIKLRLELEAGIIELYGSI